MQIDLQLYLDHMATTPMLPCAQQAMWPWLHTYFANPSSPYAAAQFAHDAYETARARIAHIFHCTPEEIICTSGGTEAINLAIKGIVLSQIAAKPGPARVLTTPIEHAATLGACDYLNRWHQVHIEYIRVNATGRIDLNDLEERLRTPATLCSIVLAHHEIGTVQDIHALSQLTYNAGVPLHLDAVQAIAWQGINTRQIPIDAFSFSGHKFGAGRGIGGLFLRSGRTIEPLIHGGNQEQGRRAGTQALPQVIAMAEALAYAQQHYWPSCVELEKKRDQLLCAVMRAFPETHCIGHPSMRLSGHAALLFPGIHAAAVRQHLEMHGVLCSSTAACGMHTGASPSLRALGYSEEEAQSAIRLMLHPDMSEDTVQIIGQVLCQAVAEVRALSSHVHQTGHCSGHP